MIRPALPAFPGLPTRRAWRLGLTMLLAASLVSPHVVAVDLQQYGRAYLAEGDSTAAVHSYGELVRQNPFDPVALNNMAVAKAAAGDYQSALDMLQRAQRLAPQRLDIRDNLTQLQNWLQQHHTIPVASKLPAARPLGSSAATILPEPPPLWSPPASASSSTSSSAPARTR